LGDYFCAINDRLGRKAADVLRAMPVTREALNDGTDITLQPQTAENASTWELQSLRPRLGKQIKNLCSVQLRSKSISSHANYQALQNVVGYFVTFAARALPVLTYFPKHLIVSDDVIPRGRGIFALLPKPTETLLQAFLFSFQLIKKVFVHRLAFLRPDQPRRFANQW
jgi:hypothetical protein